MRTSNKHQKIIKAAIKVFAQKGFFNARISDIAKTAKVADGTIYLYFNNKYDILISLFEEEIGKIILQVKQALKDETSPGEMLRTFALHHLKILEENRELAEVLQVELRQSTIFMKEYRNKKFVEYLDIVSSIIQQGQEKGAFRQDVDANLFKRAYFGALDELSRLWILTPNHSQSIEQTADQVADIFISGITK